MAGTREDRSGDALDELLRGEGYDVERRVVPDERDEISSAIQELSASILLFSSSSITLAVAVYNLYETGYIEPVAALAIINMIIISAAILIANKLGGGKIASRSGVSQGLAS